MIPIDSQPASSSSAENTKPSFLSFIHDAKCHFQSLAGKKKKKTEKKSNKRRKVRRQERLRNESPHHFVPRTTGRICLHFPVPLSLSYAVTSYIRKKQLAKPPFHMCNILSTKRLCRHQPQFCIKTTHTHTYTLAVHRQPASGHDDSTRSKQRRPGGLCTTHSRRRRLSRLHGEEPRRVAGIRT
ncbi:hypothetical protein BD289DRAFT_40871 [Coniella lustricola]|uniref:Uncharacterized protein n=1 Tax=Coniella lustricola TaxID=2025994 RepID=A0A2T3A203_9PEZI|nr:hypothetical protein BD289DRAFT_40871 [Coniella lustricola]